MMSLRNLTERLPLGLAYLAAAALSVALTRFEGGIAFFWIASALLIADLMSRPRRQWPASVAVCGIASLLATGMLGLGWTLALPFAIINVAEALIAALLFRRLGPAHQPLGSLNWFLRFVAAAGIVAPATAATLAAGALALTGRPALDVLIHFYAGHALGNLTVVPLALLIARGTFRRTPRSTRRRFAREGAVLFALTAVTCLVAFGQNRMPLLFLPILPIILLTFRLGRGGAAVGVVMLALIGGVATLSGMGPVQMTQQSSASVLHFFQFYLAATVLTVLPIAADLESRRRLHRAVRISEARYRLLADHSSDILIHFSPEGRIRYVSPSVTRLGGHRPSDLIGRDSRILVAPEHAARVKDDYLATIAAQGQTRTFDYLAATADGSKRWYETHSRAILDEDGNVEGVVSVIRDVSARKANELQLAEHAMTDPLTSLPNRRAYRLAVGQAMISEGRARADCVAVLDIDHFKAINDRHGHAVGDEVLCAFARIARRALREGDLLARIGGEEFAIHFPDTSVDQAASICDRVRSDVSHSLIAAGAAAVRITVSGGVAPLGQDGLDAALATADEALYSAKRGGRDRLSVAA